MSQSKPDYEIKVADGQLELPLYRLGGGNGKPAVLLLHGANTSSDTFLEPGGGLAAYLREDFDVWLLDWRGSPKVVDRLIRNLPPLGGSALTEAREFFTVDHVATEDIPKAVEKVREVIGSSLRLSVLGHCVGGGALSIATALGLLKPYRVHCTVLSTLGLFYEVPWNGWVKAEDYIIERVLHHDPRCRGVNPKNPDEWPDDMETNYGSWPSCWLPDEGSRAQNMLRRLAFMIGLPYTRKRLANLSDSFLLSCFGYLHIGLYWHLGQMVRRGYAAAFNTPDVIDRQRLHYLVPPPGVRASTAVAAKSYLDPTHFARARVTLLVAAQNQLWHRDSMDLMYEWLREAGSEVTKLVFPTRNIQELLWGQKSEQVYEEIKRSLG